LPKVKKKQKNNRVLDYFLFKVRFHFISIFYTLMVAEKEKSLKQKLTSTYYHSLWQISQFVNTATKSISVLVRVILIYSSCNMPLIL